MKELSIEELKQMKDREGLILQGCGGDLQEWVDGLNEHLTDEKILLNGDTFQDIYTFKLEGKTNLLFITNDLNINMGALAMWRIMTHHQFGGTWLSDYLTNNILVDTEQQMEQKKPDCPLVGQDGNIFNLMGIASRTLNENGMSAEATEMRERILESSSYDSALCIIGEYVNITSADAMDEAEDFEEMQEPQY